MRAAALTDDQPPELVDDELPELPDEPPPFGGSSGGGGKPHFAYSAAPMLHAYWQSNGNVSEPHVHDPLLHDPPCSAEHSQVIVLSPLVQEYSSNAMQLTLPLPPPLDPPELR